MTGGTLDVAKPSKGKEKAGPTDDDGEDELEDEDDTPVQKRGLPETKKTYSKDKVRMSQNDRTLDSMFPVVHPAAQSSSSSSPDKGDNTKYRKGKEKEGDEPASAAQTPTWIKTQEIEESECFLTSVNNLRRQIQKAKHNR